MSIFWTKELSLDNKTIDLEHKYLFSLINCLELSLRLKDEAATETFIDQLFLYTREHFVDEEKLQIEIKYPYYFEHKQEHQKILANLIAIKKKIMSHHARKHDDTDEVLGDENVVADHEKIDSLEVGNDISAVIRDWILDHVIVTDMKMKPFLKNAKKT